MLEFLFLLLTGETEKILIGFDDNVDSGGTMLLLMMMKMEEVRQNHGSALRMIVLTHQVVDMQTTVS